MRIGEISMNINTRNCNYGSILHSWAFQHYLKCYEGLESVETINYIRKDLYKWSRVFPPLEGLRKKSLKLFIKKLLQYPIYRKRLKKIDRFISKNMSISPILYYHTDLYKLPERFDVLVADSDTIWAPRPDKSFDAGYYLYFEGSEAVKKISYAPSMGNAEISDKQKEILKIMLRDFSHISCRESYEKTVLEECTGQAVEQVLDPVLLLETEDWEKLIAKNYAGKEYSNYLLVYEPVDKSPILFQCAQSYATQHGLKIIVINISDTLTKCYKDKVEMINDCSPEQFGYLIQHAEAIFTNSFHMICFSVLFKKEFYAFSRESDKKVIDICERLGLKEHFFEKLDDYAEQKINYEYVYNKYIPLREQSRNWLHNALIQ